MRAVGESVRRAWMRFWFEPTQPIDLAISRIVVFAPLAVFYGVHDYSIWADVSPALLQPIWLFETLHLPVFSAPVLNALQLVWKASLVGAALGVFTNLSCGISAVLGIYLIGLPHNFGQTYHFDAAIVLAFGVLAVSRCGDAWSIDAWLRRSRSAAAVPPSGEYTWPIRAVWVALSAVFFAAGVAKLWTSGMDWVASDQMSLLLRRVGYHVSDADPVTNWGSYIAQSSLLSHTLAAMTVVVETAYPLALLRTRLRPVVVAAGAGLIVGIRVLMGPTFEHFLLLNAFWIPWHRVGVFVCKHLITFSEASPAGPDPIHV